MVFDNLGGVYCEYVCVCKERGRCLTVCVCV